MRLPFTLSGWEQRLLFAWYPAPDRRQSRRKENYSHTYLFFQGAHECLAFQERMISNPESIGTFISFYWTFVLLPSRLLSVDGKPPSRWRSRFGNGNSFMLTDKLRRYVMSTTGDTPLFNQLSTNRPLLTSRRRSRDFFAYVILILSLSLSRALCLLNSIGNAVHLSFK